MLTEIFAHFFFFVYAHENVYPSLFSQNVNFKLYIFFIFRMFSCTMKIIRTFLGDPSKFPLLAHVQAPLEFVEGNHINMTFFWEKVQEVIIKKKNF